MNFFTLFPVVSTLLTLLLIWWGVTRYLQAKLVRFNANQHVTQEWLTSHWVENSKRTGL